MNEQESSGTVRKYFERASPEEQKKFAEALLASRSRIEGTNLVPEGVILVSRWLSSLVFIAYAASVGWSEELLKAVGLFVLLGAIAWFPNEAADATGRIGLGPAVSRPSHPWIAVVVAWIFLLLFGIAAVLKWFGAA